MRIVLPKNCRERPQGNGKAVVDPDAPRGRKPHKLCASRRNVETTAASPLPVRRSLHFVLALSLITIINLYC